MNISVAIATYNGEKYIKEQLDSILIQLNDDDEIIISDDNSTDNTIKIIKKYKDSRIKIYKNLNKGIISNFENAILKCNNEIIFLSDQDDVWKLNKVEKILAYFKSNKKINCVISDYEITDEKLNIIKKEKMLSKNKSILANIFKNSYMGSAMAFRSNIKKEISPFPKKIPMHDIWIGMILSQNGDVEFCEEKLFYYRRHNEAVTINSGSINKKIMWRFYISKEIFKYLIKRRRV